MVDPFTEHYGGIFMSTLVIKDLHVAIDGKEILKGVNLTINTNEIHAIMGPNGTGKSTLASAIMGHPKYEVTSGTVELDGEDVLEMEVDERAQAGLFLAMQYPSEIAGVTNADFLRSAINARREEGDEISLMKFIRELDKNMEFLEMNEDMAQRYLNEGFSGGEKKRNEILQLMMIKPTIAILDEVYYYVEYIGFLVLQGQLNLLLLQVEHPMKGMPHYELPTPGSS